MKNPILKIGETLAALSIIAMVIAFGIAWITASMKIIGYLLGAH